MRLNLTHDVHDIDLTLFEVTIAEWEYNAPKVQPVLAHDEGDTLVVHTGKRAIEREYLDTEDGGEKFTFTGDSSAITVEYGDWSHTFTGSYTKLIADGGKGDDVFNASGLTGVEVEFDGGPGDDTLTAGSAGGILIGGAGDDILSGLGENTTGDMTLDGGPGGNAADFHLTDEDDAVQAATGSVTVNGQRTFIWAFETLLVDTLGGKARLTYRRGFIL